MNLKHLFILLILIFHESCQTNKTNLNISRVKFNGALKEIMMKGDISAKANLADFEHVEHLFALGAIEDLKGEIQIFDSQSFNTSVVDSSIVFDTTYSKKATLLVYATVSNWKTIDIPENIITNAQLEKYIEKTAKENEIHIDEPFPFQISGIAQSIDWHVIYWVEGDTLHTQEKHKTAGLHGTVRNQPVDMIGFYSNNHHAVFTHHNTNMHIHVKTRDNMVAGHVDRVELGKGMKLLLPESN